MSKVHEGQALKLALERTGIPITKIYESLNIKSRKTLYNLFNNPVIPSKYIECINSIGISYPDLTSIVNLQQNIKQSPNLLSMTNCYIVPVKAFGGFTSGYSDPVFLENLQKTSFPLVRGECFMFEVEGVSMVKDSDSEASYIPGSWVVGTILESFSYLQKNKSYIFQTTDGIIIKQFIEIKGDFCHLCSLNPDYKVPPIPLKSIKVVYFIEYKINKP